MNDGDSVNTNSGYNGIRVMPSNQVDQKYDIQNQRVPDGPAVHLHSRSLFVGIRNNLYRVEYKGQYKKSWWSIHVDADG